MKLFGHPLSSCTRKVLVTLAEKDIDAEFVAVDLFAGAHKRPEYLAHHPFGVVPALDDDGFVLFESRAIIRYLDRRAGGRSLTPASARDGARMEQWLSVDQSYIAPHTSKLAVERLVKKHAGVAPDGAACDAAESALARAFAVIDDALAKHPHLAGDTLSLADISLMPYVASLPMIGAEHVLRDRPHVAAWWTRMRRRPSWQRTEAMA